MPCLLTNRRTSGLRAAHRMNRRSTALVARLSGIGRTLSAAADGLAWTVVSDALTFIERTIFRFERNFLRRPSLADRSPFAYSLPDSEVPKAAGDFPAAERERNTRALLAL